MKKIMIRVAIATGWDAFMRRPWYLFGLSLAFLGLFMVSIGDAVITAFAAVLYGGYLSMLMKHFHGEKITFDDIFTVQDRWVYYSGLTLIKTFFIILGFIFFVIPGIYLSIRWMFAEMLVIDQKMKPLEALKASSQMTQGVRGKLFLMSLVLMVLVLFSLMFFVVGVIVMSTVALFAYIKVYDDLKVVLLETQPQQTIPNIHTESTVA